MWCVKPFSDIISAHAWDVFIHKMKPELHFGDDDCPVSISDSFSKDDQLNFEIELIEFSKIKARTTIGYL
ncbi:putative peptidylprolyl isomerase [Helianthus anomalus]